MDTPNVNNIINSLSGAHNETMTKLHAAQCEACKSLDPVDAVEVILCLQRIATKVDRAFISELNQLERMLTDWW